MHGQLPDLQLHLRVKPLMLGGLLICPLLVLRILILIDQRNFVGLQINLVLDFENLLIEASEIN